MKRSRTKDDLDEYPRVLTTLRVVPISSMLENIKQRAKQRRTMAKRATTSSEILLLGSPDEKKFKYEGVEFDKVVEVPNPVHDYGYYLDSPGSKLPNPSLPPIAQRLSNSCPPRLNPFFEVTPIESDSSIKCEVIENSPAQTPSPPNNNFHSHLGQFSGVNDSGYSGQNSFAGNSSLDSSIEEINTGQSTSIVPVQQPPSPISYPFLPYGCDYSNIKTEPGCEIDPRLYHSGQLMTHVDEQGNPIFSPFPPGMGFPFPPNFFFPHRFPLSPGSKGFYPQFSSPPMPPQRSPPSSSQPDRTLSPGPQPPNYDPEVHGCSTTPILRKISKYSLTSASTGINFYFRIYGRYYKARRDSFSKDKTMMYLRCNTCPKEPCKWRAKIKLQKPHLDINSDEYMDISNYKVLTNSKAYHHHRACQKLSVTEENFDYSN